MISSPGLLLCLALAALCLAGCKTPFVAGGGRVGSGAIRAVAVEYRDGVWGHQTSMLPLPVQCDDDTWSLVLWEVEAPSLAVVHENSGQVPQLLIMQSRVDGELLNYWWLSGESVGDWEIVVEQRSPWCDPFALHVSLPCQFSEAMGEPGWQPLARMPVPIDARISLGDGEERSVRCEIDPRRGLVLDLGQASMLVAPDRVGVVVLLRNGPEIWRGSRVLTRHEMLALVQQSGSCLVGVMLTWRRVSAGDGDGLEGALSGFFRW
jgi:hypothetical protein